MENNITPRTSVRVTDIWKSYGGTAVLKGINIELLAGQVHALLGGNGAGKSTLMKTIAGLVSPDQGSVEINEQVLGTPSPAAAQALGLYLVPQEAHILPNQSVLENICLGLKAKPRALRAQAEALLRDLAVSLDLDAQAATLEIADRQIVEIMRGLIRKASVLILDEPTSALTPHEANALFDRVRQLQAQGVGIFFISHKLREIREICSVISVLRDGAIVLSGALCDYDDNHIVEAMTKTVQSAAPTARADADIDFDTRDVVLEIDGFSGEGFRDISFNVRAGEIVGLAGVVGAGRSELAETLFGLRDARSGTLHLHGAPLTKRSPRDCVDAGLVYLPEDRQQNGLFLEASLAWNMSGYTMHRLGFFPKRNAETTAFNTFRESLGIKCEGEDQSAGRLSGGNQQKVLLAKCLAANPKVLILDEPTRGVDVAARNDIYRLIHELAAKGLGVVLISSDFDEIEQLADRVVVMAHGLQCGALERDAVTVDAIAHLAFESGSPSHA
ncbi:autoinducer 2 ABC transporter ATP-binding protein LsrA [Thalassospira lohafexi]|uniref:Autoinducer 2 import ATP-binding protein LsrA n=1 Tax=Thalassospira lohafexi TaxID=744227 RepID=A0A2N3L646_9PROT|nr:autoinducer 2 ABC transporter ATP-binding protein LsrA [Thalassospira lohafexi]PKR58177.1 autoinducer 2 ABC transporter ATP-binding protein LsrA [Thalassospira lohafexi]